MIVVAVAAIVAWRVDKSRFEATLANFGEEERDSNGELIHDADVFDTFSIGDITFVILQSDIYDSDAVETNLSNLSHPSVAEKKGRPTKIVSSFINHLLGGEHELSLDEITAVEDYGGRYFWTMSWSLMPPWMSSGVPYQYHAVVRADGTAVRPRFFLRDSYGSLYSDQKNLVHSVLPMDDLLPTTDAAPSNEEIIAAAENALKESISRLKLGQSFRYEKINRITYPGKLHSKKPIESEFEAWGVEFVDNSIPRNVKNKNSATRITIWVTSDLVTSELSLFSWSVESKR